MPPRLFLSKSAEVIENKGREPEKEAQESLRVRKGREVKEIEEECEAEEQTLARIVRDRGEGIVVRRLIVRGRLVWRVIFSLWVQISPGIKVASKGGGPLKRSFRESSYGMGYARTTGRMYGLGTGE
jgi:hypothetical protein